MKRVLFLMTVMSAFVFSACESQDENVEGMQAPTIFSNIVIPEAVYVGQAAPVTAELSNEYGLYMAWIVYFIDEPGKPQVVSERMCNSAVRFSYAGEIPAQPAGTKVTFQLVAKNVYGALSSTQLYTYTVKSTNN